MSKERKTKSISQVVGVVLLIVGLAVGIAVGYLAAPSGSTQEPVAPVVSPQAPEGEPRMEEKTHAPIPDSARGPAIDQSKGYLVQDLGNGLYWLTEGIYHVMFLTTGEGVIVVDAPPSIGQNLLNGIKEVTDEPITHVIYSHTHADHIAAASMYPADATYIAHEETAAQLELVKANDPERKPLPWGVFVGGGPIPLPTQTFADEMTLTVGSQTLELSYKGPAHEPGNIYIYAPHQKVLMFIDVIFPGWSPFFELAIAEDVTAFIRSHDQILEFDFETLVSGHVGRLGTRQDVEIQREYIQDIQANSITALQTVDFGAVAQEIGFENVWLLFSTYLDRVADKCTELTEEKWKDRLGGADVFTKSHCGKIIESLRVD
ncbi:MAG: MBL fold metallo-hydrolase [Nitrososphaerales archaeon]